MRATIGTTIGIMEIIRTVAVAFVRMRNASTTKAAPPPLPHRRHSHHFRATITSTTPAPPPLSHHSRTANQNLLPSFNLMVNFTGESKRRVVNLGDRKPPARNFLQASRQQRQQREEQRAKDKSARLIQRHISHYLAAKRAAVDCYRHWAGRRAQTQHEFNEFVADFYFATAYAAWPPLAMIMDALVPMLLLPVLPSLPGAVVLANIESYRVCPYAARRLVLALLRIALQLLRALPLLQSTAITSQFTATASQSTATASPIAAASSIATAISAVLRKLSYPIPCPGLIAALAPYHSPPIIDLIMAVNIHDSPTAFFRYITTLTAPIPSKYALVLTQLLIDAGNHVASLLELEKVHLLLAYLQAHDEFGTAEFRAAAAVLGAIHGSITTADDTQNEPDLEDQPENSHHRHHRHHSALDSVLETPRDGPRIVVDPHTASQINRLYSGETVRAMLALFSRGSHHDAAVAITIISTMCTLVPRQKSKLCVLITITPGSYRWFYVLLRSHPIYKAIELLQLDFLPPDSINNLYSSLTPLSISSFWKTLYTFEELYSYWLIVSNDYESFDPDKLTIEEVKNLLKFVKTLCLTLVLNPRHTVYQPVGKLKSVSISLLNQLYLKNLRLKFVNAEFWHLNHIKFNIDSMLPVIAQEEEDMVARQQVQEDSDEELPLFSRTKASDDTLSKLEILHKLPFFIKFKDRVRIFESLLALDSQRQEASNPFMFGIEPKISGDINRESMLIDAYKAFGNLGAKFKQKIAVTFYNELGGQEAGIDGGGITKEFLTSIVSEAFDPSKHHYFKSSPEHQMYPNEDIYFCYVHGLDVSQDLQYLKFLGNIIGKCIYEGVLVDLKFAPFFLNKWCNKNFMKNSINDLASLDRELFSNLMKLPKMTDEELEDLELTFSINTDKYQFPLVSRGESLRVTRANLLNYIHQLANFKLNTSMHIQSRAFLEGLFELIPSHWLKMFDFNELQMLISGADSSIDIQDWKNNVEYSRYGPEDLTIRLFWEVVEEMSDQERSKLVKFVTSVARAPLNGFGALNPKFAIRYGGDADRLPTASTCVNLLKLPGYRDKATMRDKLLYAINTDAYFDLS